MLGRSELILVLALGGCTPTASIPYVLDLCAPELGICEPDTAERPCGTHMTLCCEGGTCYAWDESARRQRPVCEGVVGTCSNFVPPAEPPFDGSGVCYDVEGR